MSDLRYAIRGMLRNPGFSLLACLSLAIGIGANTAIYSVIDAVLLRPLPRVEDPSRMVAIISDVVSYPLYRDVADRARSFSGVAGFSYRTVSLDRQRSSHDRPRGDRFRQFFRYAWYGCCRGPPAASFR